MKKVLLVLMISLLMLPGSALAKMWRGGGKDCSVVASVTNDGTGNNRTKKKGGTYAGIRLSTLDESQVLNVKVTSGTLKYVTLHARYDGGYWKTIYQGPFTEFPVGEYFGNLKKDPRCTHVNISVNGAHERYEPIACSADIEVCSVNKKKEDCRNIGTVMNDGTGDNRTKKRGGNNAAVSLSSLNGDEVLKVNVTSGTLKYVTLHARYDGGYWKTIYQGPVTEFPVGQYLGSYKNDRKCTHVNISVNGAHERYEPMACTADIEVCAKGAGMGKPGMHGHSMPMVKPVDERKITLKAYNGQYVCAEGGGGGQVVANRGEAREWETFTMIRLPGENKVALKAHNGQYVCAEGGGGGQVVANRGEAREWETFTMIRLPGENKVAFRAYNGQYVCAEGGGGRELVANRGEAREWETFILNDASMMPALKPVAERKIALRAYNGQYVCAEGGGGGQVVANRGEARQWETFRIIKLPGENKVAFKAYNGQFVCAEGGGGGQVVANRGEAREWETFTMIKLPGENKVAFRAYNGQYLCAEGGGGRELVANRPAAREWETFTMIFLDK
jgi:hypothetical protein